jgi:hypothetical protein
MTKAERAKWIRNEVRAVHGEGPLCCPPGVSETGCAFCPYREIFGPPPRGGGGACAPLGVYSEAHKTAACLLAAIYEVEL